MKAVVKVDIVDGKCVVIYSDGSEQELYDVSDDGGGGGEAVLGTKNITSNGSYTARSDGYDGYSKVNVNVPTGSADLGTKNIVTNGTYNASSDNLDGYSSVNVNVPTGITPTGTKQISIIENGTSIEDVTNYANAEINVNVPSGGITNGTVINNWDFTQSRFDTILGQNVILANGATYSSDGVLIGTQQSNATFGVWCPNMSYEFEIGDMEKTFTTGHGRFIMYAPTNGLIYNSAGYWGFYNGGWIRISDDPYTVFSNKTVRVDVKSDMTFEIYINNTLWYASPSSVVIGNGNVTIGSSTGSSAYNTLIKKAKITVKRS